jgi:hypothetical protein
MTGQWQAARHDEEHDDSSHWSTDDGQAGFSTPSVTGIGHNPIMTESDNILIPPIPSAESAPPGYKESWPPSPPTTLVTSASYTGTPGYSGALPITPTTFATGENAASSPTSASGQGTYQQAQSDSKHHVPKAVVAMVPIALLAIIGALIFFCMRKRRKQKQIAAAQAQVQEMKARSPTVHAYVSSPLPPARPLSRSTPSTGLSPTSPTAPQPVILGPISDSNNNYFTGIDTSDIMSVRSNGRTGLGNPFADNNSINEEPPPPYYPSSVASLSRDTSLRVSQPPPPAWSQTELIAAGGQPQRSPFDDPIDDDAVSDVSGPTSRQERDDLSAVSDLSYQQDTTVARPSV